MTTTTDYVINPARFQTFFADLESRKTLPTTISDLYKTLTTNLTSLDQTLTLKFRALDTQIESFNTHMSKSFLSLQNRENAIPERESAMACRVEELKNSAISDIEACSERAETNLAESLRGFFRRMDSGGLIRFLLAKEKESVALRTAMNEAVREAVDLGGFLVDAVEEFVRMKAEGRVRLADRQWACGVLIQAALPVVGLAEEEGTKTVEIGAGGVTARVKERAAGVLERWKGVFGGGEWSGGIWVAEARMFLQMVIGFGLKDKFEEGFLRKLVDFATRPDMAKLAVALGFGNKMGGHDFDLNSRMNLSAYSGQKLGSTGSERSFQVDDEDDSPIEEVTPLAMIRKKRYKRWDYFEETMLINSWLNVSKYPIKGKDKEGRTFWQRILDYQRGSGKYRSRTVAELKKHWGDISSVVAKFVRAHSTISHRNQHCGRADLIMSEALELYFTETGKKFRYEFAWRLLKDEQKFHDLMNGESGNRNKRTKLSQSGVYISECNAEDAEVSEVHTMERWFRQKTGKGTVGAEDFASEVEERELTTTPSQVERFNVAKKVPTMASLSEVLEQQKEVRKQLKAELLKQENAIKEREHFMRMIVMDTSKMDPVQKRAYYNQLEKFSERTE